MIDLPQEVEALAQRLAAAQSLSVEAAIRRALETHARVAGIETNLNHRRRMTVEQMLDFGMEIAALPVLDSRSPDQIMDDLNTP